ncbi:MAG: DNA polymerase III subunit gamma/tau [Nitrospirae bacterium]|nr:DNA polymerase III subunit gamma/tau [Nitrospirota bacterium]MBI3351273.1 DNA polymerase III subunit gamma/tau [Nitrospirota bacterium]
MSYQVFARKWRPQKFEEMVGQAPVAQTLLNAIQSSRLAHAYLFSGARGVGKTSMARLLAKAVNCEKGPTINPCGECSLCKEIAAGVSVDVLEIDGASNRGIDNIRELKDQIKYVPLKGKYKVYIIDEVHMLTTEAFNALLKTLEEPPPHTVFILATTELHKIPSTILSRCQQFQFKKIGRLEIMAQLKRIIEEEKIQVSEKALLVVAKSANGSMRDALSILDQVVSFSGLDVSDDDVRSILGVVDMKTIYDMTEALSRKDFPGVLTLFRGVINAGHDLKYFCQEWINHVRNLMMMQLMPDPKSFLDLPNDEISDLSKLAHLFSLDQLQRFFKIFTQVEEDIRFSSQPALVMEVAFIKSASLQALEPLQNLIDRLNGLASSLPKTSDAESSFSSSPVQSTRHPERAESLEKIKPPIVEAFIVQEEDFQKCWTRLMHNLKQKKPNLESYLKQSLWVTQDKDLIKIGYPAASPFIFFLEKEESIKSLMAECREVFNKTLSIQVLAVQESDQKPVPGKGVNPQKLDSLSLVEKVKETLGGKIIEVKELK